MGGGRVIVVEMHKQHTWVRLLQWIKVAVLETGTSWSVCKGNSLINVLYVKNVCF